MYTFAQNFFIGFIGVIGLAAAIGMIILLVKTMEDDED